MSQFSRPSRSTIWDRVLEHQGLAYMLAARYVRGASRVFDIDDLAQAALLTTYHCLDKGQFDPDRGTLSTYLSAAIVRDFEAMSNKSGRCLTYPMNTSCHVPVEQRLHHPTPAQAGPEQVAVANETRSMVSSVLSRLDRRDRDALTWAYKIRKTKRARPTRHAISRAKSAFVRAQC